MNFLKPLLISISGLNLVGCGGGSSESSPTKTVQFVHMINGNTLVENSGHYISGIESDISISKLEYIVTDLSIQTQLGGRSEVVSEIYVDGLSETKKVLTVPDITISKVSFTFGISKDSIGRESFGNDADISAMAWPTAMGGGFHYMKLEGTDEKNGVRDVFLMHSGPTSGADFSFVVDLIPGEQMAEDSEMIKINMNVENWFNGSQVFDFQAYGRKIMKNASAQKVLQENGRSVFTLE